MHFSQEIIAELSTDQRILYKHCMRISTGEMDLSYAHCKIGPINHARWLALAIKLHSVCIHMEKPSENIVLIVRYLQEV